jgi:hypothetical protein
LQKKHKTIELQIKKKNGLTLTALHCKFSHPKEANLKDRFLNNGVVLLRKKNFKLVTN